MISFITSIKSQFERIGLNVVGVASGEPWQGVLPGCQSVIVLGSGGRLFWDVFLADLIKSSQHLTDLPHPLDAFVQRTLAQIDPNPPSSRCWVRCASDETQFVDFRVLGYQAGLGWESKLGLLINSEFGPWFGLRLACFTLESIAPTGPLPGSGPCEACAAPCVAACPAGAVTKFSRWNVNRCAEFHDSHCRDRCHSREICPEGQNHMYTQLQRHYHYDRQNGRQALGEYLNIPSGKSGIGPNWTDWT